MRILVSGSRGLVGSQLVTSLAAGGHKVTRLVRSRPAAGELAIEWDPEAGTLDPVSIEGFDAVAHLAGESIARRWTARRKEKIRRSRIEGTSLLAETLAHLARPPKVLVAASAIGYYGHRGDEILREESPPGSGFLAEVCRDWEAASAPAAERGIRVVNLRTGLVLSRQGGALAKMLPAFKMGVAGKIGSGRQYMSWIAIDDLSGVFLHALNNDSLCGPVNAVAPRPVTNLEFTKTMGRLLRRPTIFPLPAFAVRLLFGQMGEETLLASQRVEPARLLASGFTFRFSHLDAALRHVLGEMGVC